MNLSKIGRNIARIDNNAKKVYSVATPKDNEEHELKMINQSVIKEGKFVYTPNNEGRDTISVLGMSGGLSSIVSHTIKSTLSTKYFYLVKQQRILYLMVYHIFKELI